MPSRKGPVYVATISRPYKGTVYTTHLLRRTYREAGKVKHQKLGNVSHLPKPIIEMIHRALKGETLVPAGEAFQVVRSLPHGHVEVVLSTIGKLGSDTLIASRRCRERELVSAMIVQRLIFRVRNWRRLGIGVARRWPRSWGWKRPTRTNCMRP